MRSAIYTGQVKHRRFSPKIHSFHYGVAFFYLDLAEIEGIFCVPGLFSQGRGVLGFRRSDYLGDATRPLDLCVRDLVQERTNQRPVGPIRLLTQLRYLGHCFNPVSFYYCFDDSGERLEAIVAEITNTPWGERHAYVLPCAGEGALKAFDFPKIFHVSPFMPLAMDYAWKLTQPGERITVYMQNFAHDSEVAVFDASLQLKRRPLTAGTVVWTILKFPLLTLKTIVAIYFEAFLLKLKRVPSYSHSSPGGHL